MLRLKSKLSILLILVFAFTLITPATLAKTDYTDQASLSKEEAGNIAIWFIADNIKSNPQCEWSDDTRISKIVDLFDENDKITAYSLELRENKKDNGYVIVSANDDTGLIKEYAFEGKPLYYKDAANESEKIFLTGPLEYSYKKNGEMYGLDARKTKIDKKKIKNKFVHSKEHKKHNKSYVDRVKKSDKFKIDGWMLGYDGQVPSANDGYGGIYDSYAYVIDRYGSGWTADYWGSMENEITPHLCSDWSEDNNCSLVAISTIFEYHEEYNYGVGNIPSDIDLIYEDALDIADSNDWWSPSNGTDPTRIDNIVDELWDTYHNEDGNGLNDYAVTWSDFVNEIDDNTPCVLNMNSGYYTNHSVTVIAYSVFKKSGTSTKREFIKVFDGWTTSGRYIDYDAFKNATLYSLTKIDPY